MSTAVSSSPEVSSPEGFSPEGFSTELPAGGAKSANALAVGAPAGDPVGGPMGGGAVATAGAAAAGDATAGGADAPFTSPADKLRGRELDRQILALALPALGGLVASPIFVMIDSSMVGHLGADPLAALSLASSILTTAVGLFVFLTYATTATTARHFGAGRRREGLKAGLDGIWLAAIIGVLVAGVAMLFAPQIVAAMGAKASVATNAVAYLRMVLPGLPGMLVVLAATGTLRGLLDTRTPFIVALAGAVLNTLLNAFFLYVVGLGVAGSGLGTALAELSMGAALVAPIARAAHAEQVSLRPRLDGLRASMGEGLGLFVRNISLRVAILSTVWAATALGATALASYQVVNALWGVCSFGLDALAIAAQALIGQALGRAAEARRRGDEAALAQEDAAISRILRRCMGWTLGVGVAVGLVVAGGAKWLPWFFTSDAPVRELAFWPLLAMAASLPLVAVAFLYDGILMGAGDGRYLAVAGVINLVPYLPAILLLVNAHEGLSDNTALMLLWGAFAFIFMGMRALTTGWRIHTDAWKK